MAKMMGNDIVTQEEFDRFVGLTVLPLQLEIISLKRKVKWIAGVIFVGIAVAAFLYFR